MHEKGEFVDNVITAAVEIGNFYSGYAFAFKGDPTRILMNKNWGGLKGSQTYKTPTSVLVNSERKLVSFGFTAEEE